MLARGVVLALLSHGFPLPLIRKAVAPKGGLAASQATCNATVESFSLLALVGWVAMVALHFSNVATQAVDACSMGARVGLSLALLQLSAQAALC